MSFDKRTLIIGDLSGIQEYLFDVANEDWRKINQFETRSFFIKLAAECLALRIVKASGCSLENLLFCGAGQFIVEAASLSDEQRQELAFEYQRMSEWLYYETNAQLRLTLTVSESGETLQALYKNTIGPLQHEKLRAWAITSLTKNKWQPGSMILPPLDMPCQLCGRRKGVAEETKENGNLFVCFRCYEDRKMGKAMPQTRWIALSEFADATTEMFHLPGWKATLHLTQPTLTHDALIHVANSENDFCDPDTNFPEHPQVRHLRLFR